MKKKDVRTRGALLLGAALVACLAAPLTSSAASLSNSSFLVRAQNGSDSSFSAVRPFFKATSAPTAPPTTDPSAPPATAAPSPASDFTWSTTATAATVVSYNGTATSVVIPSTYNSLPVKSLSSKILGTLPVQSVVIPDSVTSIAASAFMSASSLKSVSLPSNLTSIGTNAFYGASLESLSIPSTVTSIGSNAFFANNITSLTIPDSVTSMGVYAFQRNQISTLKLSANLKVIPRGAFLTNPLLTVTIPSGVTSIEIDAFNGSSLTTVYLEGNAPTVVSAGSSGSFGAATGKTIYRKSAATGYSNPWNGYTMATY